MWPVAAERPGRLTDGSVCPTLPSTLLPEDRSQVGQALPPANRSWEEQS